MPSTPSSSFELDVSDPYKPRWESNSPSSRMSPLSVQSTVKTPLSHTNSFSKTAYDSIERTAKTQSTPRWWRHTIGRVSCLARIPIYAGGAAVLTLKTGVRFVCTFFSEVTRGLRNLGKREDEPGYIKPKAGLSFKTVMLDAIMCKDLAQRTINAAWLTLVAPPPYYRDLQTAAQTCYQAVVVGQHHSAETIKALWRTSRTPNYWEQMSPCTRKELDHMERTWGTSFAYEGRDING